MSDKNKTNNTDLIIKNVKKGILLIIIGALIVTLFNLEYIFAKSNLNKILDSNISKDVHVPEGILRVTSEYNGDIESYKVVLKSIADVAENVIPKYYEVTVGKSTDELKTYFEKHHKVILIETGIETADEYLAFAETLKTLNSNEFVVQDYYVDITTILIKYNRIETNIVFEYENGQSVVLNAVLNNITPKDASPIKYLAP